MSYGFNEDKSKFELDDLLTITNTTNKTLNSSTTGGGWCRYFKIGKLVVVTFGDVTFKTTLAASGANIVSSLPKPQFGTNQQFVLVPMTQTDVSPVRLRLVASNGNIETHYAPTISSASLQYYGLFVYLAAE